MTTHPEFGDYQSIIVPDDRKRFPLGRLISREPTKGWKAYRSDDGRRIYLEAIVDE